MLSALICSILIAGFVPKGTASEPHAEISLRARDSLAVYLEVSRSVSAADTVRAGEAFITNLPDSLCEQPVTSYRGIALPARSWLMGRTFFWKTSQADRGAHSVWFRAIFSDGKSDSLSVGVFVL